MISPLETTVRARIVALAETVRYAHENVYTLDPVVVAEYVPNRIDTIRDLTEILDDAGLDTGDEYVALSESTKRWWEIAKVVHSD